jgi:uncharacterized protein YkwD
MITLIVASALMYQTAQAPYQPTVPRYEPVEYTPIELEKPEMPLRREEVVKMATSTPTTTLATVGFRITAENVLAGVNNERIKIGLAPLVVNEQLVQAAKVKAHDMSERGYWAHDTPEGKTPFAFITESGYVYTYAGENLAKYFKNTPAAITGWMESPTHKANIVNTHYTETGIAIEGDIIVQMFGTK